MGTITKILNVATRQTTVDIALVAVLGLFVLLNIYLLVRLLVLRKHSWRSGDKIWNNFLALKWRWFEIGILGLAIGIVTLSLTLPCKVTSPSDPSLGITNLSPSTPLVVEFNRRIDRDLLSHEINPPLPGEWVHDSGWTHNKEALKFVPDQTPELNTRYTISLVGIKNILGSNASNYLFSFATAPLPEIKSISINEGDEGVAPNQDIIIETDDFPDQGAQFEFATIPEIELNISKSGHSYHITAKNGFAKGTAYALKIYRTATIYDYKAKKIIGSGEKTDLKTINFSTVAIPSIKATSPSGSGVLTNTKISVEFRQDMQQVSLDKLFTISPAVTGSLSWENSRKLTYTPQTALNKNTTYTVKLTKGAITSSGDTIPEDISFSFTTIGYVIVSKFSPTNGATGIADNAAIAITFNQAVDHASAESKFTITPDLNGSFTWNGNTMTFSHNNFTASTKYSVVVTAGVKSVDGLDSKDAFSAAFTTKTPATTLNVPSYKQAHMYSCMAVAARNALAFKGVNVSEASVLSAIGYDNTAWSGTWAEGGAIWGDPDSGIVGNVDGKANNIGWGYGSHSGPVAKAIRNLGRTADVKSGWDVAGIASEIANGNPVIVWWVNGVWPAYNVYWKTPSGKSIRGVNSMHVQVVKGFTGTAGNPLSFTVTDSGYGYPSQTFDVGTFKAKWGWFGNTAIVVK